MAVAALGMKDWLAWRSIPKSVYEASINDTLLKTTIVLHGVAPDRQSLALLAGESHWKTLAVAEWPAIQAETITLAAGQLAALIAPPEIGEGSGIFDRDVIQDIPAPPPSQTLVDAPFKIGTSPSTYQLVGIDPDGHGMATGGSRTGKTSSASSLLQQLIEKGDDVAEIEDNGSQKGTLEKGIPGRKTGGACQDVYEFFDVSLMGGTGFEPVTSTV